MWNDQENFLETREKGENTAVAHDVHVTDNNTNEIK